ncbi:two-component system sensor histidine kinase [Campylobacter iguaniorum]|nr:two-component system sensor histidine kinase [Campylobacter iguaniorum]
MLRIAFYYLIFIALFFFCFWLVLGENFLKHIYIIIVVSLFLSMSLTYIAYEISAYQNKRIKDALIRKDRKLRKQTAKLRIKNAQLENLLSGISHEFKNPISVIKMSAQTLLNDADMHQNIKHKFTTKIISNSNKMNNILNRLRIGFGGDIEPHLSEFDARKLCLEVSSNLETNEQKIIINGEKTLKADYDMIYQVVLNLTQNALKYSKSDVQIDLNENGIFIKDSGEGIDEDELKLIQKKFYKSKVYDWNNSLGLGLYIVKIILKLHNFEFVVRSQKGVGSIFGFRDKISTAFRLKITDEALQVSKFE